MAVVDWEMVRRGCGATDVGQFAAESWLLERFHGGRGLLGAFLGGYRYGGREEEGGLGRGKEVGGEGGGADGGAFGVWAESGGVGDEGGDGGGGGAWI